MISKALFQTDFPVSTTIVINAVDVESMNKALKSGVDATLDFEGVIGTE